MNEAPHDEGSAQSQRISRRALFGFAGAAALGTAAAGFVVGDAVGSDSAPTASDLVYPFRGVHQAGITTPAQDRLHFVAFDLRTESRSEVIALLQRWTAAAERMCAGGEVGTYGAVSGPYDAPPDDTGEALDLPAAGLTITFGFGRSFFTTKGGADRFGVADRMPASLVELPHFPGDTLEPGRSDGDICVQACSNDPQVAVHAVRNLARLAFGVASVRWSQLGFGRTSSTSTAQQTPRNLFGFKDGTANLKVEQKELVDEHVWVQPGDDQEWMTGGSILVARRIRMLIETWDRTSLREQENIVGRTKGSGAPLSGGEEFTEPDFALTGNDDQPLIPELSHVKLAHPSSHDGARLLRRGYNFVDGSDELGRLNAGLFFLAYQRDPRTHFIPVQTALARDDGLNEYLRHVGSGIYAIPPGAGPGEYIGEGLFA